MTDKTVIVDSIAKISRDDWNSLATDDVYGQHGWLKAIETSVAEARHPTYILLYRNGRPLAAAAMYRCDRSAPPGRLAELLYGRAAVLANKLRLAPAETLYCGPIMGQGRHLFWDKDCCRDEAVDRIRAILRVIEQQLPTKSTPVVFGRIPANEIELIRELRNFGYIESRTWPISYIDLKWATFDDYLKSLARFGKNMRTKARREIAAAAKNGIEIESTTDLREEFAAIDALFRKTQSKYSPGSSPFGRTFVESLTEIEPDRPTFSIARSRDNGAMVGCALLLRAGNCAAGPLIGIDSSELNRKAFTYFNLSLYTPIRYCIENEISRIYFGSGLGKLKSKRGCDRMDVFVFVLQSGLFARLVWKCWMWLHLKWVNRKAGREIA